ncbi:MAG: hypothetical protein ACI4TK_11670 [Agathobacter sp.]
MRLVEQIEQWESQIKQIREADRIAHDKNMKKVKELQDKIDNAKAQKKEEDNRVLGDMVRSTFGEINEETLAQMKELLRKYGHTAAGMNESEQ